MENLKLLVQRAEVDKRTAALLAGAACGAGAAVLLIRRAIRFREAQDKIQRARERRTESLQRAEEAVQRYKESVSCWGGEGVCDERKVTVTSTDTLTEKQ